MISKLNSLKFWSQKKFIPLPDPAVQNHPPLYQHYYTLAQNLLQGTVTPQTFAQQMVQIHHHLERRSDHDGLIESFLNNNGFTKALQQWLPALERFSFKGVLLALDIDHLKKFNDNLGHVQGDKLIRTYAKVIEQHTREADLKGRLGGDEFGVFLMGSELKDAQQIAERIRVNIIQIVKEIFPQLSWQQTVSIGLAEIKASETAHSLRERADKALYEAKKERNKTVIFSEAK